MFMEFAEYFTENFSVTLKPTSTLKSSLRAIHIWEIFCWVLGGSVSEEEILKDTECPKHRMTAEGPKPEMSFLRQPARARYLISLSL